MSFTLDHDRPQHLNPDAIWDRNNHVAMHRRCNAQKGLGGRDHLKPPPRSRDW
jgi:hypothetical protein